MGGYKISYSGTIKDMLDLAIDTMKLSRVELGVSLS
jgi:hypothetical protein